MKLESLEQLEQNKKIQQTDQLERFEQITKMKQMKQLEKLEQLEQLEPAENTALYYRPPEKARHLHMLKLMVSSALLIGVIVVFLVLFAWSFNRSPTHVAGVTDSKGSVDVTENNNHNQNDNDIEVNMTIPLSGLPTSGTLFITNPVPLNGYGQPGQLIQVLVDGNSMALAPISETGQWSTTVNLGSPGSHQLQLTIYNQNNQLLHTSPAVEVLLLDPTLGEVIKQYPNLANCEQNAPLSATDGSAEDENAWVMPEHLYPILCVDESQQNNSPSTNSEQSPTPVPVTNGKG